jgi:hypothetical protein
VGTIFVNRSLKLTVVEVFLTLGFLGFAGFEGFLYFLYGGLTVGFLTTGFTFGGGSKNDGRGFVVGLALTVGFRGA